MSVKGKLEGEGRLGLFRILRGLGNIPPLLRGDSLEFLSLHVAFHFYNAGMLTSI